jgi:hypothetical protein
MRARNLKEGNLDIRTCNMRNRNQWGAVYTGDISLNRPKGMNTVRIWLCDCAAVFLFQLFYNVLIEWSGIWKTYGWDGKKKLSFYNLSPVYTWPERKRTPIWYMKCQFGTRNYCMNRWSMIYTQIRELGNWLLWIQVNPLFPHPTYTVLNSSANSKPRMQRQRQHACIWIKSMTQITIGRSGGRYAERRYLVGRW